MDQQESQAAEYAEAKRQWREWQKNVTRPAEIDGAPRAVFRNLETTGSKFTHWLQDVIAQDPNCYAYQGGQVAVQRPIPRDGASITSDKFRLDITGVYEAGNEPGTPDGILIIDRMITLIIQSYLSGKVTVHLICNSAFGLAYYERLLDWLERDFSPSREATASAAPQVEDPLLVLALLEKRLENAPGRRAYPETLWVQSRYANGMSQSAIMPLYIEEFSKPAAPPIDADEADRFIKQAIKSLKRKWRKKKTSRGAKAS